MQNITVKKADGTTDVVWTGIAASAGDKSPAIWRNATIGTVPAERPTFMVTAQDNGTGTSRRVKFTGSWPTSRQDAGGNKVISGRASMEGSFLLPQNIEQATLNEVASQFTALIASDLMVQALQTGISPR